MSGDSAIAAYIARQAATLGRRCKELPRPPWQPRLPNAKGHCLGMLQGSGAHGASPASMGWRADDRSLIAGGSTGRPWCRHLETGALLWEGSESHDRPLVHVALSPDGARLATASADATVRVWNAANGRCALHCADRNNPAQRLCWSNDSQRLAAILADDTLRIWDARSGQPLFNRKGDQDTLRCLAWSPDDRWLASGAADRSVCVWDARSGECVTRWSAHENWVSGLAWSPDGRWLATLGNDHRLCLWDVADWRLVRHWPAHPQARFLRGVIWSPDGRWLASAARDGTLRVWDVADGRELLCYAFPEAYVWELVWSPDGRFLISSHEGDVYRFWDCRALFPAASLELAVPAPLPAEWAGLPRALASLHRLKQYPSLSLLCDLLRLCSGGEPEGLLAVLSLHPGMRRLADLRWPLAARIGLVALLLRALPLNDWRPPPRLQASDLPALLHAALTGESIEPTPPEPPLAALYRTLAAIDERGVSLLVILGADAVAADPGLPLRLWRRRDDLPALNGWQRRWMDGRIPLAGQDTVAQGGGAGGDDLLTRGQWRDLCPTQLALPAPVLLNRYLHRELLYYTHDRSERRPPRSAVLVLDVSPPCFGPVESVTRLAAHIITGSLLAARLPVALITAGGLGAVAKLEQPADKLEIWTSRSQEPARAAHSLRLADSLRELLHDGREPQPPIVVLSHAWFGAEETIDRLPGLRGLFVQYPGQRVRPVLADHCERWVSLAAQDMGDLL
ncbi:MAG: WD40 repeat domain-containing protein, partial [Gammaproteobacteria bacterium]|nr:WD40 repeat domain-containing protein [Gammaproteobacteria bacterium]